MSKTEPNQPPIHLVRALAGRGEKVIDGYQALVDQARAMLASGNVKEEDITAFPWELEDRSTHDQPRRTWAAHVDSYVSGAGLTVTLYVALAHSEAELRQLLSRTLNRDDANAATVAPGLDALDSLVPGASALAPDYLRWRMLALESGDDDAAVFTFLAQSHANYG